LEEAQWYARLLGDAIAEASAALAATSSASTIAATYLRQLATKVTTCSADVHEKVASSRKDNRQRATLMPEVSCCSQFCNVCSRRLDAHASSGRHLCRVTVSFRCPRCAKCWVSHLGCYDSEQHKIQDQFCNGQDCNRVAAKVAYWELASPELHHALYLQQRCNARLPVHRSVASSQRREGGERSRYKRVYSLDGRWSDSCGLVCTIKENILTWLIPIYEESTEIKLTDRTVRCAIKAMSPVDRLAVQRQVLLSRRPLARWNRRRVDSRSRLALSSGGDTTL
jgi:hypothetical protein